MKFELKEFQVKATRSLLDKMLKARNSYYRDGDPASCCLAAPTGSGKTIMVAAAVEALFNGNHEWGIERDPSATVLWVSDSPTLNEQTIYKFREATDLDRSLIETIENTFTGDHKILEPGHIYFLNRQKLSSAGLLTKGGEIPTFWDLLRRTINDPSVHLFMLYDEAHKGLGSAAKKDTAGETITAKIIDGEEGKMSMPVVVGISATPKNFTQAMANRSERIPYPIIKVKPADVQASGLLKDKIILQAPTEGAAVYNIYLNEACRNLIQSTAMWDMYCTNNDEPMVRPLMVVQVQNKISHDKLREICVDIYEKIGGKIPDFSRSSSFAHVISGEGDLHLEPYEVPNVEPQDVQRKSDIRVLFAKEAISTGWDCPRAEVIFSMRTHSDDTYIEQLIGRMVRTPLAENVNIELLNSVSCYLPYFDPKTLEKVVKYLTEENNEDSSGISQESGRQVVTKPVDVTWDPTFGIDAVFTGIASRERAHSTSNYIDGVISYAGMLEENEISQQGLSEEEPTNGVNDSEQVVSQEKAMNDGTVTNPGHSESEQEITSGNNSETIPRESNKTTLGDKNQQELKPGAPPTAQADEDGPGELDRAIDIMLRALNEAIITYSNEFEVAKSTVLHAKSTKMEFKYLDAKSVKSNTYEDDADAYAIANARRRADVTLSPSVTNAFFRQEISMGKDPIEINVEIAAAAAVPEIVAAVIKGARDNLEKLTEEYDPLIAKYPTSVRNQFASGMSRHGIPHTVFLDKPVADTHDKNGKMYPKHVVNDPKTHKAWFNLYESEDSVVMHELKNPNIICWYRNPVGKTTGNSLRIAYRLGDDRKTLHPDFIFFEKCGDREMPAIVDPHGLHLADTLPKLKGIARYVEDFGETYSRYWFVSDYKGKAMYLDMKDSETRTIVNEASDAFECFAKCAKVYMDQPLSKVKEGYRKK